MTSLKRVLDLETGELMEKTEYQARVKRIRQVATNKKRKHYRQKRKEIENEVKDFIKNIDKQPEPKKPRKTPIKPRKTTNIEVNGDIHYKYIFEFDYGSSSILEFINKDIDDMMEVIEENLNDCFSLKSIKEIMDNGGYVMAHFMMRNVSYSQNENKHIWAKFSLSKGELYQKLRESVERHYEKYQEDCLVIDGFELFFIKRNPINGRGSTARSIQSAEKTWRDISVKTRNNCLYCAVGLHINKHNYKEYLEEPNKLLNIGKQLKFKLKKHFDIPPKKKYSTDAEIQMCADYLRRRIILYNNQYRKVKEFEPETLHDKKDIIEIRINNGHYSTLLRRRDINEEIEEETPEEDTPVSTTEYISNNTAKIEEHLKIYDAETGTFNDEEDILVKQPRKFKIAYNDKYAAYDIEATPDTNDNNYHKAYAVGFAYYTKDCTIKNIQFWGLDCQERFLDYLLQNMEELHKYTIYAHNGGRYDYPNLLREALLRYDRLHLQNVIELNGRFISFQITDGTYEINFRDSICILNGSLDDLTKEFGVKHKKLKELVNHDEINLENYMTHKPEISKYLTHDCLGLLEVIQKFSKAVFKATGINLSQIFTNATLSKKHFYKNYYNQFKSPIYFLTKAKDQFVRKTYFGGRNEAFQLREVKGKIYYYDFTSLYPSTGCRYLPFGEPEWVVLKNMNDFKKFFGFCDVWVRTLNFNKKPIHPVLMDTGRSGSKRLVFPHLKNWTKLRLFSQEIRLGIDEDIYEYKFEHEGDTCFGVRFCSKPILMDFFKDCFVKKAQAKKEGNDAIALTHKTIANSGYGFFGLRWCDRESIILGHKRDVDYGEYLEKGKLINICEWENSNYTALKVEKDLEMKDFNVGIASAITSYARMRLWKLIDSIESKGSKVYYCDTDSVITNCDITKHDDLMREFCWDGTGDELGSLKNEVVDEIKKFNRKNPDKKIDIELQKEHDGGDFCFDECYICGCKFYAISKKLYNGESIFKTKLKGFKNYKDSKLEYHWYKKLVDGDMDAIEQDQKQWNLPKSSMVDEQRVMGLNITPVHKVFKINYTKGIEDAETHEIRPHQL
jgi:hypothetical protein